jgi:hypothetical protein
LTTKVEKAQLAATRAEPEEMHYRRMESLSQEKSAVEKSISRMQEECRAFEKETQQLRSKNEAIVSAFSAVSKEKKLKVPRAKYVFIGYIF